MAWLEQLQAANGGQAAACAVGAYALGCFATGYYLVRTVKGQDIRHFESGSVGARNVGRVLGWTGFLLTLVGDFGKGVLALARDKGRKVLVGFTAETEAVRENALSKLRRKNLDLIVANDVSAPGTGFDVSTNAAILLDAAGGERAFRAGR